MGAILINAAAFGVFWWPLRYLNDLALHTLWATTGIYLVATVVYLSTGRASLSMFARRGTWMLAIAAGGTNAAFNLGLVIGDIIRVVLLFYLMPVWAAFLGHWLLGEKITLAAVGRILIALAGASLILYKPGVAPLSSTSLADLLGLIGGMFFALLTVTLRREAVRPPVDRALAMSLGAMLIPGALALALTLAGQVSVPPADWASWAWPTLIIAIVYMFANLALLYGAARLPANVTATILISEVLFAALSAVLFAGAGFDAATLIGGALIVAAALTAARQAS